MLALYGRFRVPPTVALPRYMVIKDPKSAADRAISVLESVKKLQMEEWRECGPTESKQCPPNMGNAVVKKGVGKLGIYNVHQIWEMQY